MIRMTKTLSGCLALALVLTACSGPADETASSAEMNKTAAADFPASPPPPGPAPQIRVPAPAERTLENGLRVIVVERHDLPLVTASLTLLTGSETDPPALAGLADLASTMLTRGTRARSATEIAEAAAALGGSLGSWAGWDESGLSMTVTTPNVPAALALMAEVALEPAFAGEELERLREEAQDGLRLRLREPRWIAAAATRRLVFGDSPYGAVDSGTEASLAAISTQDLAAHHARWYRPDNAVLVLAGDLQPAAGFDLAATALGSWQQPAEPLVRPTTAAGGGVAPAITVIDLPDAGQAAVAAGRLAVPRESGDYYAGLVTNAVLGGSYSARLNEEIRIKRGLSYGARSDFAALRDAGWFSAMVQTKNPSAAEVAGLVREQFASLAAAAPTADELAARKATMIGGFTRSLDTTGGLANQISDRAVYGVPLAEINEYIRRVEAVDGAAVHDFAAQHLAPEQLHVVIVGDAKVFGEEVRKTWPEARFLQADRLDFARPDLGAE